MSKVYRSGVLLFTMVISVVLSAVHIFLMEKYYEPTVDFFKNGTNLPNLFYCILATLIGAVVLLAIIRNFIERKSEYESVRRENMVSLYFGLLTGFIMIVAAMMRAKSFLSVLFANVGNISLDYIVSLLVIVSAIPSAFYFFVISFQRKSSSKAITVFGTAVVFWAFLYVLDIYFDTATALTSPIRILNQLTPIAFMLFFIYDMRQRLGIPKPIYYMVFAFTSVVMSFVTCSAEMYLFITGETRAGGRLMFTVAELCMALYILSCMSLDVKKRSPQKNSEEIVSDLDDIFDAESEMDICDDELNDGSNDKSSYSSDAVVSVESNDWWKQELQLDLSEGNTEKSSGDTDNEIGDDE